MSYQIIQGDVLRCLRELPENSVHCVVTSPPYWGLRDYGVEGQIGLEAMPEEFIAKLVEVFREVRRVLRKDGTCWVNMGDAYSSQPGQRVQKAEGRDDVAGWKQASNSGSCGVGSRSAPNLKAKDLIGQPWMLAFALRADGWWLRQDIVWSKPNPMPESVTDRCTKSHEYIFLLTKSAKYFYDAEAIKERATADHPAGNTSHKGASAYLEGDERHRTKQGLVAYAARNGKNSFRGQGANRDSDNGPALRGGRDMSEVGTSGKRNKRSVWEIATEPFAEAHFATFPTKLVKPCILAGTSEHGCCAACGAPWERQVSVGYDNPGNRTTNGDRSMSNRDISAGFAQRLEKRSKTVGWKPSCVCAAEVVPCTVLDPFSGSGTTGIVALANRCNYIGIEINPEYVAMSERRLRQATQQMVLI